jgi:signal transduction histidine kinase
MAGELSAEERLLFEARSRRLLLARARIGLWILLTFILLFSLADRLFNPGGFDPSQIRQLAILRVVQVLCIVLAFRALARSETFGRAVAVCAFSMVIFNAVIALGGVVIRDAVLAPTVLMSTNMFSAAFLPWGLAAQVVVAAASAVTIVASAGAVGGSAAAVLGYNQLEAYAGLAASLWVAAMLHRQRLDLFVSQRARDAAVAARLSEARVADALARVGREMIEAADTARLVERMCAVTAAVLGCETAHAYLIDAEGGGAYVPVAAHGHDREQWETLRLLRISREHGERLAHRLEVDGVAEVATKEAGEVVGEALAAAIARAGTTHSLLLALERGTELIGVLHAGARERNEPFDEEQRRIARGIVHLASMTIEHARVREELERANEVKAHFVATLSHELRNPITAIQGYNYLLLQGMSGTLSAEQEDVLRRSDKCARELGDLITATLDLSRFEAKVVPIDVQRVRVADLVGELRREIHPPGDAVRLEWPADLDRVELSTDPLKLKMVLRNLVTNALKFTERGSVTVAVGGGDGGVEFGVRDTGIGIAREHIPALFDPFTQAHGIESRRKGGAGLGLHLVRRLVEVLGGTIDVTSEVGVGSTFRVCVPDRAAAAPCGDRVSALSVQPEGRVASSALPSAVKLGAES